MKLTIIWPAYPFRWGIAHHTNQLANALIQVGHKVRIFTFSRQYPRLLYPGRNQVEPQWTQNPLLDSPDLSLYQLIDTLNVFSWYRTARAIIRQKPDYCLIKYWHPYFVPCFTFITWFLRRNKIPVICIIDNIFPHERHRGDILLTRLFFSQISWAVTQSNIVHNQFQNTFSHIPETMILHPIYDQFWPPLWQKEARQRLQIPNNKKVLLFFWFIRPYKGLDILIRVMPYLIPKYPYIHLLIAWECFGSFEPYQKLIVTLNLSQHITTHLEYVPNSDIPTYFGACDILVMPYQHITNSGIDNIGKAYARCSLLTVWLNLQDLRDRILELLATEVIQEEGVSWNEFVTKLDIFLNVKS